MPGLVPGIHVFVVGDAVRRGCLGYAESPDEHGHDAEYAETFRENAQRDQNQRSYLTQRTFTAKATAGCA